MDKGAWWATVHRVRKSRTRLSDWSCTHRWLHRIERKHFIFKKSSLIALNVNVGFYGFMSIIQGSMLGITRYNTASSSSLSSSWGQHLSTMVAFLLNPDRSTRAYSTQIPRAATHRLVLVTDRKTILLLNCLSLYCDVWESWDLSSVQFSCSVVSDSLQPHGLQHTRPPCPSPTPRVHPNPCPLSWWCHPTISSSVVPSSSCPQSFPASGSFPMCQLFTSGGGEGNSARAHS